ncbi:MAG TPA: hypothetical protein VHU90_04690 [Galbitalea sp.]|nr:hypothetical protein [Galbitalea sp.]
MEQKIVVLTGRIASGKSTLASGLAECVGAEIVSSRGLLKVEARHRGVALRKRRDLQNFGTALDLSTDGEWLPAALESVLGRLPSDHVVVVDSVRMAVQLRAFKDKFDGQVVHVHLTANDADREARFLARRAERDRGSTFEDVSVDVTESRVEAIAESADLVVDTSASTIDEALRQTVALLNQPA